MSAAAGESRIVDQSVVVLLIAEELAVCSGRCKYIYFPHLSGWCRNRRRLQQHPLLSPLRLPVPPSRRLVEVPDYKVRILLCSFIVTDVVKLLTSQLLDRLGPASATVDKAQSRVLLRF
jgi:hypothetical protein